MKEKTISKISIADGLAGRLALVIRQTGQNQSEFERCLGTSAGFISDAARGVKKPDADFLHGFSKSKFMQRHLLADLFRRQQMEYRSANILKVWPQRGSIECLHPDECNPRIIELVSLHCR